MLIKNRLFYSALLFSSLIAISCKKYLNTKSAQNLSTPSTLSDLRLLLDNPDLTVGTSLCHGGTDEYYVSYEDWLSRDEIQQQTYVWDPHLNNYLDWETLYKTIFITNTVLFNLSTIDSKGNQQERDYLEGTALFIRSNCFYQLAQLFAPQYDPASARTDLGISLRLDADFNKPSTRASVQQTYDQIIKDLSAAVSYLPNTTITKTRPGKAAGFALLARVYLQMGNYEKAKEASAQCLQNNSSLLDYNTRMPFIPNFYPFPFFNDNPEILYYVKTDLPLNANYVRAKVDSTLYDSYNHNDLRKQLFYYDNGDGTIAYIGTYSGDFPLFSGLATDEVYLIRAECHARMGDLTKAMGDLNTLLKTRWATNTFLPLTATSPEEALSIILAERKKELINRGTRWSDLRRLNKDPKYARPLTRKLDKVYTLSPNDLRYVLLIPREVINISKMKQNQR